ncbi:MAG: sulfatase-like hydrolase/transferase [Fuerstiella sp.]|nr:sulfatase-like hydrolase/transferase [Fuerstiella sp.]MCP4859587.1 sulfatase-like hydrolase/transferase [Fuerstiella sp.]
MSHPISRRNFVSSGLGATAAANSVHPEADAGPRTPRKSNAPPNIVWIMTDQQRYDCVGANGNPLIQTPNLDRLAAESANFSHAFVQSPVCTPSRACFFTGRYAHAHRCRVNYTVLNRSEVLLPQRLRDAGYDTRLVGKLHLAYQYPAVPQSACEMGFNHAELHDGSRHTDDWSDYVKWRNANDPQARSYYRKTVGDKARPGQNPYAAIIDDEFTDTTWTGERTRAHLREASTHEKPFFLFSSYWKPHSPFEVPAPFDALHNTDDIPLPDAVDMNDIEALPLPLQKLILRGNRRPFEMDRQQLLWAWRSYYASITHIDREVGRTLDLLDELGQRENTIVVFCSDHGDQMLEHGLMGKNVFFEESVRVPLMIRAPGMTTPQRSDELVESIDVMPTLFNLCGLDAPAHMQGRDLTPLLTGKAGYASRDAVFSENIIPEVITIPGHQFHRDTGIAGIRHPDAKMVRTRKWKYNYYPEGYEELYDLESDPKETRNLSSVKKGVAIELRGRILDWLLTASESEQIAEHWLVPWKR